MNFNVKSECSFYEKKSCRYASFVYKWNRNPDGKFEQNGFISSDGSFYFVSMTQILQAERFKISLDLDDALVLRSLGAVKLESYNKMVSFFN